MTVRHESRKEKGQAVFRRAGSHRNRMSKKATKQCQGIHRHREITPSPANYSSISLTESKEDKSLRLGPGVWCTLSQNIGFKDPLVQ
ncbi:hypothetical protein RRG08_054609 [Elysia crispata]|uniref:Uncharacterized protein n=1 Tax=Elysia crispata TaxID=231223 RepID=A0AAE1E7Z8_9GAST|nr:hypothetical protein RRG08_054609 [Elysia crispata]